jgi:putative membrane protein
MKHIRSLALLGATALVGASFAVSPAQAGGTPDRQTGAAAQHQPLTAQSYVMYAGNSDLYEIEAAKLAMQRAQDPEVKSFAAQMVRQHQMSTSKIAAAAKQSGLTATASPVLTTHMQQKLDDLRKASDSAFDERYITQQVEAHERALRLHRDYAQNGDKAALKTTSMETAKVVEQHLAEARRISTELTKDRSGNS